VWVDLDQAAQGQAECVMHHCDVPPLSKDG
jgi:hypothetical protein